MRTAWKIAGENPAKAPMKLQSTEIYPGAVEIGAEFDSRKGRNTGARKG